MNGIWSDFNATEYFMEFFQNLYQYIAIINPNHNHNNKIDMNTGQDLLVDMNEMIIVKIIKTTEEMDTITVIQCISMRWEAVVVQAQAEVVEIVATEIAKTLMNHTTMVK